MDDEKHGGEYRADFRFVVYKAGVGEVIERTITKSQLQKPTTPDKVAASVRYENIPDGVGRELDTLIYGNGLEVRYIYDILDRISEIQYNIGENGSFETVYSYT